MKKRVIACMLGVMVMAAAVGCGTKEENGAAEGTELVASTEEAIESVTSASGAFDLKGSDYVTLIDYSDISVGITGEYDVDDAAVQEYFTQMFDAYGPFYKENPDKTTIEEGDIVDVDYVGKLDGEAFEGGSAEHQKIDVYNNTSATGGGYIDGFTDGLKGASVGDVIDCDVTFPEDYPNTELAGKAVVFTFTVHSIQQEMTIDDVDDAFAKEQFQVETVDQMYDQIRSYMESNAAYNKERDTYLAVQDYLVENCTVDVPEDYLAARVNDYKRQYIEQNCGGDESQLADYLSNYYGKTVEEMEEYWNEGMEKSVRLELIMDAIAEELGIAIDQEEYDGYVAQMVTNNGYESAEAMYNIYGYGDTAYGERYFTDLYTYDKALEKVLENVTVTVEKAAESTESVESAETEAVGETEAE